MALKITMSKSGAAAEKYFNAHLRTSDYLSQDGARPGIWFGKGAERLGLEGEVAAKDFLALAGNRNPKTGERLTVRDVKNARPGYDFTFSGPKSFAAVWARTGDERLIEAFRDSILDTIREDIEPEMKTRLRRAGQDSDVVTGNLVGSLFLHDTTRPLEEDGKPDPHPHGHAYIFNRTWAVHEKRWQAAQLGDLHLDGRYFEAAFEARLGVRVQQLGYEAERDGKGSWEIVGVPPSVNLKFSRRRFQEILPEAERLGITDGEGRSTLAKRTRQDKIEGETLATPALHAYWNSRLTSEEAGAMDAVYVKAAGNTGGAIRVTAEQAVRHAIEHFFGSDGRNSAESEKAVLEEALRYGAGGVLPEEVKKELARQDLIRAEIGGRLICTTAEVLSEEQALKQSAWSGRHACAPLSEGKPYVPQAAMAAARGRKEKLDGEQAEAVRHLLDSEDRTQILIGKAGTGKTTTLQELDRALRERGRKLMAFAPTARASRGVLRKKGFATADTLANLLDKPQLQSQVRGQVILIDEAGLAGTRALRQVLDLVDRHQAQGYETRVILVGDPLQHRGVPRGQVLTILQEQAGLKPARLSTIRRQKDPGYRQAVELLSAGAGKAGEAFDQLDRLGFIREVADAEERYAAMAKDYADCHAAGDSEMIIAPTHAEGRLVAAAVRAELKTRGQLGVEDHTLLRLENKDRSIAQRKDAASYDIGDTIQWGQNAPGWVRGDRVTVVGRDSGRVLVEDKGGQVKELPLALAERFELYRTESLPVADGERLRVTRNGYALTPDGKPHALNNGDVVTVRFTKQGDLIDQRGWIIPASFGHLASGVVTSVASQGMDDNVPFLAQSATSRGAASAEQFYVSVSRGIKSLHLYTDDKEALRAAVVRSSQARSAAEVWEASQRQQKTEAQARRKRWWQRRWRGLTATLRQRAGRRQREMTTAAQRRQESRGQGYAQS